ncbi:tetratricopeptide repeat protein [Actinosynnema sp. NPDC020468]|uniref:ATP-binding protein n=1 Tax=Actinosynnema sp. NPDC020468 TaxID=3154488 RepID=UPI0033FAAB68
MTEQDPGTAAERRPVVHNRMSGPSTGVTAQVGVVHGGLHLHAAAVPIAPRQLPAAPLWFTGRAEQVAELDSIMENRVGPPGSAAGPGANPTVAMATLGGPGGIGKTWLALHWAHRHAHRFPDGTLFADLRGFSPVGEPLAPDAALFGFLVALGVPPDRVPTDLEAKAALFRSVVAGRHVLVVLDNARTADQVVPLLPGSPTCAVVVTSRHRLASLIDRHGARHLQLDGLSHEESREVLAARLGEPRIAAEPTAADDLVELCRRYPIALSILARHAHARPTVPLAEWVAELRDLGLEMLADDDPSAGVPSVLSWSLRSLNPEQRTMFALLGIAPGPDTGLPAAAGLAGRSTEWTRRVLRALENASLVDRQSRHRYSMHDLIRAYAASLAVDLPGRTRQAAARRVVDFYLHTAHAADRLLNPHRDPIRLDPPAPGARPTAPGTDPAAVAWLAEEHPNLIAAQRVAAADRLHEAAWQLAWSLHTFHARRGHRHDDLAVWRIALDAASHLPDPNHRVIAHRCLGRAAARLGRHEDAVGHLRRALDLAGSSPVEQAHTHRALASAWEQREDYRRALEHARRALDLYRTLDRPIPEAQVLNGVGWFAALLHEFDTARAHCEAALALFRRHDDPPGEAATLDSLGWIAHHTGDHREAVRRHEEAIALFRSLGYRSEVANALERLGQAHLALDHPEEAGAAWREALDLYREQGRDAEADRVRRRWDGLGGVRS